MTDEKLPQVTGVTIDAPHSRDLDDAIHVERQGDGWLLRVSISDVARVIRPGDGRDAVAYERAYTRYHAEGNQPMLTHALADHRLSLIEGRPRRTLTVTTALDAGLEIRSVNIEPTLFVSRKRFSYAEVDAILGEGGGEYYELLRAGHEVAQGLLARRRARGALAIYDINAGWMTNEEGRLRPIAETRRHLANIIIQELMIVTNQAVAEFLAERGVPALFRNHTAKPMAGDREVVLRDIAVAVEHHTILDIATVRQRINMVLNRATYGPTLLGHYGLNLAAYLHFTSPIRRYADLVNHRIVHAVLAGQPPPYSMEQLAEIGAHVTRIQHEMRDARAERERAARHEQLRATVAQTGLAAVDGDIFHRALKLASREGRFEGELATEALARLARGLLQARDFYYLLFEAKEAPAAVRAAIIEYLAAHPEQATSVINTARQTGRWGEFREVVRSGGPLGAVAIAAFAQTPDGELHSDYMVAVSRTLARPRAPPGRRARAGGGGGAARPPAGPPPPPAPAAPPPAPRTLARQRAHLAVLALACGVPVPAFPPAGDSRAEAAGGNPIGQLQEIAQEHHWPMPRYRHRATGQSHTPRHFVSASVLAGGELVESAEFEAAGKQEARRLAAADLINRLAAASTPAVEGGVQAGGTE